MRRRLLFAPLFTLLIAAASPLLLAADNLPSAAPLFAATLHDLDDRPVALDRYKGKPLIVNFWARWCGPCRQEIPELARFRKVHKGKIEVIGIGIEDRAEPVREFAKAYDMDYPVFVAKEKGIPLMQALGNDKAALPYTMIIDRHGQVVSRKLGVVKRAELEAAAETLLGK